MMQEKNGSLDMSKIYPQLNCFSMKQNLTFVLSVGLYFSFPHCKMKNDLSYCGINAMTLKYFP